MAALVTLLIATSLLISSTTNRASAETYTVGDEEKWNTGVNYLEWSRKHNFTVGDVLLFSYTAGQHDAYEVTEETYRSCDASSGVLKRYTSGQDRVTLAEARNYWFICNTPGHCLGGMKFGITVRAREATGGAAPVGGPDTRPGAAPPLGAAQPGSKAGGRPGWVRTGSLCLLAAIGFLNYIF